MSTVLRTAAAECAAFVLGACAGAVLGGGGVSIVLSGDGVSIWQGDARALPIADESVDLIVTSPPYNARINYDGYEDWLPWDDYWHGLIEPCIKAGTSERGVCPECGAPWVRVVERGPLTLTGHQRVSPTNRGDAQRPAGERVDKQPIVGAFYPSATTGWRPSCKHEGEPVPATVLDCFGGAGTSALVAERLGRNSILVELNPEYAQMARRRINGEAPMFSEVSVA